MSKVLSYPVGQDLWLRGQFVNAAYAYTDPTAITCTITLPDGTTVVKTKTDFEQEAVAAVPQAGRWRVSFTITQSGMHKVEMKGSIGSSSSVDVGYFRAL